MSIITNIEWANHTWSPWYGCRRVSEECVNCYIEFSMPFRTHRMKHGSERRRTSESYWKQPLKWDHEACIRTAESLGLSVEDGLAFTVCGGQLTDGSDADEWIARLNGFGVDDVFAEADKLGLAKRPRVFPSLCDWLDDEVPIEWLADFLKLIHATPNLDWLLLTKRPENAESRINAALKLFDAGQSLWTLGGLVPHNVWIGVSAGTQKWVDKRIPQLLNIPAKIHFLSCEPLLSPIDLGFYECDDSAERPHLTENACQVDWVIVGGESTAKRRDCGVESIVDLARQCQAAKVPVFVKQDCALRTGQQGRIPDEIWKLKQFPKV